MKLIFDLVFLIGTKFSTSIQSLFFLFGTNALIVIFVSRSIWEVYVKDWLKIKKKKP